MPVMLDLFCGLGGASAAMRERGWTVIGVDNRPELEPDVLADIATYCYDGPPVDLLWASPPCTEFAKADKRCWYPDAPNPSLELVEAALRIVVEARPRWWLLENVRGARPYFLTHVGPGGLKLGAPVLQRPPTYLWGSPPPGLLLPPPGHGHKEYCSRRSSDPRAQRLTSNHRRSQLRAIIPYPISYAVARAVERALQHQEAS